MQYLVFPLQASMLLVQENTGRADFAVAMQAEAESKAKRERHGRSAAVKQRISDSMLLNWHHEPNRRLTVSKKLKVCGPSPVKIEAEHLSQPLHGSWLLG